MQPNVFSSTRRLIRTAAVVAVIAAWTLAAAFFAVVGWRTALGLRKTSGLNAIGAMNGTIVDLRSALISAGYSLGGALLALGVTGVVLPRGRRRPVLWLGAVWLFTTIMLLGVRQIGGWPLVAAALIAFVIALVAIWLVAQSLRARSDRSDEQLTMWRESPP